MGDGTQTSTVDVKEEDTTSADKPSEFCREAILFMVGAFMIEAVIWGLPSNYGVFEKYYGTHLLFENNKLLSSIGTLATGIPFLGAPFTTPLTSYFHHYRRHMIYFGCVASSVGLLGASFATRIEHLILAQGVVYGLGFLVLYYPLLSMLNEWFVARRGLAYGILFAAAGISGLGLPFLLQQLLDSYGFSTTLRIYAAAILILVGPTLPLLRSPTSNDVEASTLSCGSTGVDISILKKPLFIILTFSNLFQSFPFFIVPIYLPSYASTLLIASNKGTILLCLLNLAQVLGQLALGYLSDKQSLAILIFTSTSISAIIVFTLWYLAPFFSTLVLFSLLCGFFAGSYVVLYSRFISLLTTDSNTSIWLYGVFAFERGLGIVLAGPISGALLGSGHQGATAESYKSLILFVGTAFATSSLCGFGTIFIQGSKGFQNAVGQSSNQLNQLHEIC